MSNSSPTGLVDNEIIDKETKKDENKSKKDTSQLFSYTNLGASVWDKLNNLDYEIDTKVGENKENSEERDNAEKAMLKRAYSKLHMNNDIKTKAPKSSQKTPEVAKKTPETTVALISSDESSSDDEPILVSRSKSSKNQKEASKTQTKVSKRTAASTAPTQSFGLPPPVEMHTSSRFYLEMMDKISQKSDECFDEKSFQRIAPSVPRIENDGEIRIIFNGNSGNQRINAKPTWTVLNLKQRLARLINCKTAQIALVHNDVYLDTTRTCGELKFKSPEIINYVEIELDKSVSNADPNDESEEHPQLEEGQLRVSLKTQSDAKPRELIVRETDTARSLLAEFARQSDLSSDQTARAYIVFDGDTVDLDTMIVDCGFFDEACADVMFA